jgi:hypothetical protein
MNSNQEPTEQDNEMNLNDAFDALAQFDFCLETLKRSTEIGALGLFGWFAKNDPNRDNAEFLEAHDYVTNSWADAEMVRKIEVLTGKNIREQLTVEQAQALYEEAQLRKMGSHRN